MGFLSAVLMGCGTGGGPQNERPGASGSASGASGGSTASGGSGSGGRAGGLGVGGSQTAGSGADAGSAGSIVAGSGGVLPPDELPNEALLPARIRRLTNEEYAWSVRALLNDEPPLEINFPPDSRQDGFTRNDTQRVDAVLAKQLDASAQILASRAKERAGELTGCGETDGSEACAQTFI
ncbi:MAG TPA: DUF1587 domain-containing protein, partial [Polyangiaceae bacterium]